jgi:hypothetical protein
MKKKLIMFLFLMTVSAGFSDVVYQDTAQAGEINTETQVPSVSYIVITQNPSKTTYMQGEELDFSDMVLVGFYVDGTYSAITDYQINGYDSSLLGTQTVYVSYQNIQVPVTVTVTPGKITNVSTLSHSTTSLSLAWNEVKGASRYEVYTLDELTGTYNLTTTTAGNSATFTYLPGTVHSYRICAVMNLNGIEYRGEYSDVYMAATDPDMVSGLKVTSTSTSSVTLSWDVTVGATGYMIYRSTNSGANYTYVGTASTNSYTDEKLSSGKSYMYQVRAYTLNDTYRGAFSNFVDTSTNPAKVALKYKAGEEKVRLTWSKVSGATSYDIYIGDEETGFALLTSASDGGTYIADDLITGNTYSFYAVARRDYKGTTYDSPASDLLVVPIEELKATSTTGKYFPTEARFFGSNAYKQLAFFSQYVDYSKSIVIPGLVTTNVGGFSSTTMCPQGITFAKDYMLLTAYDLKSEENSVIYVIDKNTQELITTLILPSKTHAGGICFDGVNVWVPTGSKISSIPFTDIQEAVDLGEPYIYAEYSTTNQVDITASYLTYYNKKIWIGTYNELETTNMYSYSIEDKDTAPFLIQEDTIVMPTRVQGAAFTSKGTLILSRSCQLYQGLRGYMRQLDLYKPDFANAVDGNISLGDSINTVEMPSMNEGIAVSGSYLYVNFESAAFDKASYKMDRICAFKLTSLNKKIVPIK